MRTLPVAAIPTLALALAVAPAGALADKDPTARRTFTFEDGKSGAPPAEFSFGRTGSGKQGRWAIVADPSAPSGKQVLAQLDADRTDYRFPVAVAAAPLLADGRVAVKCKPVSGEVDQACGLVFRYIDAGNYYVTRANALEGNVRLYFVKDGKRHEIASWSGAVTAGAWHDYAVEFRGEHVQVSWDGAAVIHHADRTFAKPGKVGLWTKADSVTYFDDLVAEPL
ncbi:MAG TPA: hypothetical protein VEL05_03285 [Candidatus Acidoferrum sp.]|nr:hypothetical protein [Candidatus Acidoferrum sp.]